MATAAGHPQKLFNGEGGMFMQSDVGSTCGCLPHCQAPAGLQGDFCSVSSLQAPHPKLVSFLKAASQTLLCRQGTGPRFSSPGVATLVLLSTIPTRRGQSPPHLSCMETGLQFWQAPLSRSAGMASRFIFHLFTVFFHHLSFSR